MKRRWYLIAALMAVVATAGVVVVPERPRWTNSNGSNELVIGFTSDGREFVTHGNGSAGLIQIIRRDADTGAVTSRTTLDEMAGFSPISLSQSTTGIGATGFAIAMDQLKYECQLYSPSGEVRGVFPCSHQSLDTFRWSPDGRWFAILVEQASWAIMDVATLREAFRIPDADPVGNFPLAFSMTSDCVAVLNTTVSETTLEWYALPTGESVGRVAMPPGIHRFGPIIGRRVVVEHNGRPILLDCSTSNAQQLPAPSLDDLESIPDAYWQVGPNWCARVASQSTPPFDIVVRNWLATKFAGIEQDGRSLCSYAVFDPVTLQLRGRVAERTAYQVLPSPDGQCVVCMERESVACWNTPQPRGPYMAIAGAGSAFGVLLLGRWFGRCTARRAS